MRKSKYVFHHLDLFSGVGGFSLSLKDQKLSKFVPYYSIKTIGYCDNLSWAQKVLLKNMNNKNIDQAPLFEDIKKVNKNVLHKNHIHRVDIMTAGFPCQDVSVMNNKGKGLEGSRSSLGYEVLRIANEMKCPCLIFENSPNIIHKGLDQFIESLQRMGYTCVYDFFSASQVGAPHYRKRFYMMAFKDEKNKGQEQKILPYLSQSSSKKSQKTNWSTPYPISKKIVPYSSINFSDLKHRTLLLGNAIVPQCATYAIGFLANALYDKDKSKNEFLNKSNYYIKHKHPYTIQVPPSEYKSNKEFVKNEKIHKLYLSTPLSSHFSTSKVGSLRALDILQNQIMYDTKTLDYIYNVSPFKDHKKWLINPQYIEYLMGYPIDWTFVDGNGTK